MACGGEQGDCDISEKQREASKISPALGVRSGISRGQGMFPFPPRRAKTWCSPLEGCTEALDASITPLFARLSPTFTLFSDWIWHPLSSLAQCNCCANPSRLQPPSFVRSNDKTAVYQVAPFLTAHDRGNLLGSLGSRKDILGINYSILFPVPTRG